MIKTKLIIRTLLKAKNSLIINIVGLSVAFCAVLFLASFVIQELSYDKHIKNHERIHRMITMFQEGEVIENNIISFHDNVIGLKAKMPEVDEVLHFLRHGSSAFKIDKTFINSKNTFAVDPNFFKVFDFEAIYGDAHTALNSPDKIVITQELSQRLFGDKNPVGEQIIFEEQLVTIGAVIKNIPANTHFYFDSLKRMSKEEGAYTSIEYIYYVLFKEGVDVEKAARKCEELYRNVLNEEFADTDGSCDAKLEPISDIHLKTVATWDLKENGNLTLITVLILLSLAILIIALSNYINLLLAKKEIYIKRVSVQKVFGISKTDLLKSFFIQSLIVIVLSLMAASCLFVTVKPWVANYIGVSFIDDIWQSWEIYLFLIGVLLVSVLATCVYPSIQISRYTINDLIHSHDARTKNNSSLLVFQFALVCCLLIAILVVHKQISFIENKPKGFNSENVLSFRRITDRLENSWPDLKKELSNIPHVTAVTGSHAYPGRGGSGQTLSYKGQPQVSVYEARVKPDYLDVFGIELKEGAFFTKETSTDATLVLNEKAVMKLGIENPIGKQVNMWGELFTIIGVVKDYNYSTLKEYIQPLMLTNYKTSIFGISFKLDGFANEATIKEISQVLHDFDPNYQVTYAYLNDELHGEYEQEHALRRIFYLGTSLALLIVLFGLLAYAAALSARRTKEIGIRKVNGATTAEIILLLSIQFIKPIIIAFIIASPIAYYGMRVWLNSFAYQTELSWWIFAMAGFITIAVSLITVSWQSWWASTQNPVNALRYE